MRADDLLGVDVVDDRTGRRLGTVHDLRVVHEDRGRGPRLMVVGLVLGPRPADGPAHRFGFVEKRAAGPALLRALTTRGVRDARYVDARAVVGWGSSPLRVRDEAALRPMDEVVSQ